MDLLTDVLDRLRLRGTVYFQADFASPWGMEFGSSEVSNFHLVIDGECWAWLHPDQQPRQLSPGDLLVFPHGNPHRLAHAPDGAALPAQEFIKQTGREHDGKLTYGGGGQSTTTIVCGHFNIEEVGHPMWDALPEYILLAGNDKAEWVTTAAQMSATEHKRGGAGAGAVVDRLAEVMLIQVIRRFVDQLDNRPGFIAAMKDKALSRALAAIHKDPKRSWSVNELATEAGVSRSSFSEAFNRDVGMPPMRYLTHWRMMRAREMLGDSELTIAQVSECVGYESEFAFAKAYKRVFGEAPGMQRRRRA